jgi:P27 family predicted phage terminase small subunit
MKGRKPKSLSVRLLAGNPGGRALPHGGSPFHAGPLEKPGDLDLLASQEWDRLTMTLAPVLSEASRGMVLVAVSAFSQMMSADAIIQKEGMTYQTNSQAGTIIRMRPEVRIRDAARTAYHRALAELGASPVSQVRVRKLPEREQGERSELDELLG